MKDSSEISKAESNVRIDIAKFTFENGDSYEGKYQVDFDRCTLVKQGYSISYMILIIINIYYLNWKTIISICICYCNLDQGIYVTDNFDTYNGTWQDDKFAGEFHIR